MLAYLAYKALLAKSMDTTAAVANTASRVIEDITDSSLAQTLLSSSPVKKSPPYASDSLYSSSDIGEPLNQPAFVSITIPPPAEPETEHGVSRMKSDEEKHIILELPEKKRKIVTSKHASDVGADKLKLSHEKPSSTKMWIWMIVLTGLFMYFSSFLIPGGEIHQLSDAPSTHSQSGKSERVFKVDMSKHESHEPISRN